MASVVSSTPKLLIHRHHSAAQLPTKSNPSDIGWDVRALLLSESGKPLTKTLHQRQTTVIETGISLRPPEGCHVQIFSRYFWALKGVLATTGIIDPGYSGELKVLLYNGSFETQYVQHGMRIARIVLASVVRAEITEHVEPFPESPDRPNGPQESST